MLLGLVLAALPGVSYVHAEEEETAVIVLLVPDGELERLGEQLAEVARFAGREVGVRVEATGTDGRPGLMRELSERSEVAAVINVGSASPSTAREAEAQGLPLVVYGSSEVEGLGPRVFRARLSADEQAERVRSFLEEKMGMTSLGLVAPRTSFGDRVTRAFASEGLEAVGRYDEGTTDFLPALEVLVGTRVYVGRGRSVAGRRADRHGTIRLGRPGVVEFEALIIADSDQVVARLLPFLPRVGIQTGAGGEGTGVQLVGLSGWRGDGLARAGDHAVGAIFFDTYGGTSEGGPAEEFAHRFEDEFGREATTAEAEIYDLVGMIGSGLRARQEGESFADAALVRLQQPRAYPGVTGSWSFQEGGEPARYLRPFRVIDGGRWVPHGSVP